MAAAIGALVLASVLWGTTGTSATFLTGGVSPLAIGATTMTLGGALLFATSARSSLAVVRSATSSPSAPARSSQPCWNGASTVRG